ncbi:MFS transporter [Microbacterium sp. NPDC089698]|uniref:MFS transporter n=1 Tax=Microbacterium sp. NPDC089698 TaxID=3364200 RepID=UPI0037F47DD5
MSEATKPTEQTHGTANTTPSNVEHHGPTYDRVSATTATPAPLPANRQIAPQTAAVSTPTEPPKVGAVFIAGVTLATFATMLAFILPSAFSLSVALARIAPGQEQVLGGLAAVGALGGMITGPALGVWSDRTRSRFGRRRQFLIGGVLVGLAGLAILGIADNIGLLYAGWSVTATGLNTVALALINVQADRLPPSQRGRVAGLTGFATMAAPVLGVALASTLVGSQMLLFVVPGVVAAVLVTLFAVLMKDPDTRGKVLAPVSFGTVASKYVFNPRKYPAYAWNWLGRLVFFMGITGSTTYTTFFFAQRLGMPVEKVAGVVAGISMLGIIGGIVGGLGSGFLSDKLKRRRIFILIGALGFAAGSVIVAVASDIVGLSIGMLVTNLGVGVFSAVDQAIVLDVLPERDTDAGRYNALMAFSQGIPNIIAPLIAALVITFGATTDAKNYTLLYLLAGAFALMGALIIYIKVKAVR